MEDRELTILLAEYDGAREVAHHSDDVIYAVAAIVWAANTILLGLAIEAKPELGIELIVALLSVLGILLSVFVIEVVRLMKIGQHAAFKVCQRIEEMIPLPHQLHRRIHECYPAGAARRWFWVITIAFIVMWAVVLVRAGYFVCKLGCSF